MLPARALLRTPADGTGTDRPKRPPGKRRGIGAVRPCDAEMPFESTRGLRRDDLFAGVAHKQRVGGDRRESRVDGEHAASFKRLDDIKSKMAAMPLSRREPRNAFARGLPHIHREAVVSEKRLTATLLRWNHYFAW